MKRLAHLLVVLPAAVAGVDLHAYPLYGSEDPSIRRLEADRLIHEGALAGRQKLSGELLSVSQVEPRLVSNDALVLPAPDPVFTARIEDLLGEQAPDYAVAVLDLSGPGEPAYAAHEAQALWALGSVGKVVVAMGLFQALADAYPRDVGYRRMLLRDTVVSAGELTVGDQHEVRLWDAARRELVRRPIAAGDRGNLWEYLDWMLSASSNAAANVVMREAMLMRHFGRDYPVPAAGAPELLTGSPPERLRELFHRTFVEPLARNGIDERALRQGSFFGRKLRALVPPTPSYGSAQGILTFLLRLEQGLIVDRFSSTEMKRLLYVTERRVRYAAAPALRDAAVYFKSGSLYECEPEEGYRCEQFLGNKLNLMNSIAIVESPAGSMRHFYLVSVTSNVLRRNSALDHQVLATRIHQLIVEGD